MGWESFGVVGFDLRPLLPGQTKIAKLKVLITRVLLYPPEASGGYFGLASATPPPLRVERFSALTL